MLITKEWHEGIFLGDGTVLYCGHRDGYIWSRLLELYTKKYEFYFV